MSKRAAIAKVTGVVSHAGAPEPRPLRTETVAALAKSLAEAISSVSGSRKAKPSRSACSQLASQVLVVAAGLRRAALVDALDLSTAQASAISSRLVALTEQKSVSGSSDLQHVRLLYHGVTGQTFIVSRRQNLWADMSTLDSAAGSDSMPLRLWIDARLTPEHSAPSRTSPDTHVRRLLERVHQTILADTSGDVLIVSQALLDSSSSPPGDHVDTRLVGVALAGFLLEYGAVYCLHNGTKTEGALHHDYQVRPLGQIETPLLQSDFAPSPPNCLGSQPLFLFKISCRDALGTSFELISFSIPQCNITPEESERARRVLTDVFQTRVDNIQMHSMLANGRISIQITTVVLHQVSL
ncbi:uncharacterized protein SPSC_03866 [Sporisorium scitamineum]|uniref:Uncharacterized protein n=1 Tax=Sporisorium scitamineum TaxID=49012 RepID=A0A127Z3D5_9BASI|nr:uncharacterized protein SPSC_03866 [Sporisorium scitamineum]